MKRILCIFIIVFIGATVLSMKTSTPVHTDYWQLFYNDRIIFSAHTSFPDTIITLDSKTFKSADGIRYSYHPCMTDDQINYLTKLYLITPQKIRMIVATQKSNGFWFGTFSTKAMTTIIDSCNCDMLQLEETTIASWKDKKGKNKRDAPQMRIMLKIKVTK